MDQAPQNILLGWSPILSRSCPTGASRRYRATHCLHRRVRRLLLAANGALPWLRVQTLGVPSGYEPPHSNRAYRSAAVYLKKAYRPLWSISRAAARRSCFVGMLAITTRYREVIREAIWNGIRNRGLGSLQNLANRPIISLRFVAL